MRLILVFVVYFTMLSTCFSMENVFYVLRDQKKQAIQALTDHKKIVDTIIFQAYIIDNKGKVSGEADPEIIAFAKKHNIHLMPMVTNSQFDFKLAHQFLSDPTAQKKALDNLLNACIKYQCYGIQFDFEMIPLTDKKLLTDFYQMAADLFHKNNLIISFAIAPTLMDDNFPTAYQKKLYTVWQGAYDFKKLGEISDFVTIMAYDQHGIGTIPGPIASLPWVALVIKHALSLIPANKISLGIPTYSGFWYMSTVPHTNRITTRYNSLDYQTLQYILKKYQPRIFWDDLNKANFSLYDSAGLNKYIFIEDAASFKAKDDLAIKYNLRGISVFRLGIEDPNIWNVLQKRTP